ncbi:hypothetical protein RFI_11080, partial [Reticulomyxa filosa]
IYCVYFGINEIKKIERKIQELVYKEDFNNQLKEIDDIEVRKAIEIVKSQQYWDIIDDIIQIGGVVSKVTREVDKGIANITLILPLWKYISMHWNRYFSDPNCRLLEETKNEMKNILQKGLKRIRKIFISNKKNKKIFI